MKKTILSLGLGLIAIFVALGYDSWHPQAEETGGLGGRIFRLEAADTEPDACLQSVSQSLPPREIIYNPSGVPEILHDSVLVQLSGKLVLWTFPGYPNYESIEDGDTPDQCWILELDPESRDYMWSLPITGKYREYFPDEIKNYNLQLTAHPFDKNTLLLNNKSVTVCGFLGSLVMHVHTPFLLEVVKITHEQQ